MLDSLFIREMKKNLEEKLLGLTSEIDRLQNEEKEDVGAKSIEDVDRAATELLGLEKQSQIENLKKDKELIITALNKIESGKYGICEKCRGEIDKARLSILPDARLCMDCKIICDKCGVEIEEARVLGKQIPPICQNCEEEVEPETFFTSSTIQPLK